MFILYFALWVILNGRWTTEIALFGVAFAAIAYVFTCKFLGYSTKVDAALFRRAPRAIHYGVLLLSEIVKANITVIRMILNRNFEPKPQLVTFDTSLQRERHRVTLANSITLTPGTITVDLEEGRYLVHCLDEAMIEGLDDGVMVKALEKMEKLHVPQSAPQQTAETAAQAENKEEEAQHNGD
ncbi:MAG: Na+/H+ antiporter subunit E [Clostridia bacterium]|nr:Na+/H+ antiporter subunit E [Clostridia bacterium]MBQ2948999.1 Na+/H+ antiporter subunit E [Clostridia bacterium]MBQ4609288.1 Na+/H+ antiporter subunit E [Clostridia bacterium]MBQ6859058.1 Na+/H+ antiporter subunit E [Clostridia bacterium]MBQ7053205.1 Na+/H+ antiporter subunit E [Clostridia bacterium]